MKKLNYLKNENKNTKKCHIILQIMKPKVKKIYNIFCLLLWSGTVQGKEKMIKLMCVSNRCFSYI